MSRWKLFMRVHNFIETRGLDEVWDLWDTQPTPQVRLCLALFADHREKLRRQP